MNERTRRKLLLMLLTVAGLEFAFRGPVRTFRYGDFTDFNISYVASRVWLSGADPYDPAQFMETWVAAGGKGFHDRGSATNTRPAYPPTILPILAPFGFCRWPLARTLFSLVLIGLFPFMLWSVMRLAKLDFRSNAGLGFTAFALALSPWHAAIAWQSITAPAVELAILGVALESILWSGVGTGVVLCLKPQLGGWFLLFELTRRRWRHAACAVAVFAVMLSLALLRLPSGWTNSYQDNLHHFFAIGEVNDFTSRNLVRFELLNLQVVFYYLWPNYQAANILAWLVTGALLVLWGRAQSNPSLARVASLALIGLLPVYQRIYNAGLIVLALGWAFARWRQKRAKLVLIIAALFLVPLTAILQVLHARNWITDSVWYHSWWFNVFVGPHATWALLLMIAVLLFPEKSSEESPPCSRRCFPTPLRVSGAPESGVNHYS